MASRKKGAQVLFPLDSSEALQHAVDESDHVLAVVDVFQSWTGPCSVMDPVFRKIKMEKDKLLVKFFNIDEALLSADQRKFLPPGLHTGCKPLFLFFKNKIVVAKIMGANAPELEQQVVDNANTATGEEE